MKSFNQHITKDREKLDEDLTEKKDEKLLEDMTDILWAAAAGAGLWGIGKAWDKWGKDMAASLPFATKKMKTDKAQRRIDKDDEKTKDKETHAKAKALGYKKDDDGIIISPEDAQEYRDETKSAPEGWATSSGPGKDPDETPGKPDKGTVWTKDEEEKWNDDETKRKEEKAAKKAADAARETDNTDTSSFEPKGTKMTITESNELQAIMALDDAGIKAEINRKGEVVVKKKDLKKAKKALEKSFKKGGEPKLVGEEVHRTAYEVVSEARTKVIKNKPKWEPEDSEPRLS